MAISEKPVIKILHKSVFDPATSDRPVVARERSDKMKLPDKSGKLHEFVNYVVTDPLTPNDLKDANQALEAIMKVKN